MAKLQATDLHPYLSAESAHRAIEDGESSDSSESEKYRTLCTECESIAVQIHPSYTEQYVNVAAMMSMPHRDMPLLIGQIAAQYLFLRTKKEIFKAIKAKLEGQTTKDWSASASKLSCGGVCSRTRSRGILEPQNV